MLRGGLRPWSQKGPDHGVGVDPSLLSSPKQQKRIKVDWRRKKEKSKNKTKPSCRLVVACCYSFLDSTGRWNQQQECIADSALQMKHCRSLGRANERHCSPDSQGGQGRGSQATLN